MLNIKAIAADKNLDYRLLHATAVAESNMNNFCHRPEPGFWRAYMRSDIDKWYTEFRKYYKTIEPTEELLISLFASSYGMCQLMYTTAVANGFTGHPIRLYDEKVNLNVASTYLKHLYDRYPEIRSSHIERMKFTIAAYNAGRGSINAMLRFARQDEGLTINQDGKWQYWDIAKKYLHKVTGTSSEITIKHVDRIKDILAN